jgi:cell surface protein SprA
VPAFIAAYTGKDPNRVGLDFFPSLMNMLPNWKISYEGFIQLPLIKKHFKSFILEHEYKSRYTVGSYGSYSGWREMADGIGYVENMTTGRWMITSPYDVMAVNITEAFDPFIRINSVFLNNMTMKFEYKTARNVNLNMASYQIVEMTSTDVGGDIGYRIDNFNRLIHFPRKTNAKFNNELRISAGLSYRKMYSLNRKIQDALTQPTTGNAQTLIKFTADYSLSKLIVLQAYYDRQVSTPLVSATSFPMARSTYGLSLKVSLAQ